MSSPLLAADRRRNRGAARSARTGVRIPSSFGRARQVKLLRKLAANYTPRPPRVNRRGERKPAASTVKAVIGLGAHHADAAARGEEEARGRPAAGAGSRRDHDHRRRRIHAVAGGSRRYARRSAHAMRRDSSSASRISSGSSRTAARPAAACARPPATPRRCPRARSSPSATTRPCAGRSSSCAGSRRASATASTSASSMSGRIRAASRWPLEGVRGATGRSDRRGQVRCSPPLYLRESAKQPAMPFKTLIMASDRDRAARAA